MNTIRRALAGSEVQSCLFKDSVKSTVTETFQQTTSELVNFLCEQQVSFASWCKENCSGYNVGVHALHTSASIHNSHTLSRAASVVSWLVSRIWARKEGEGGQSKGEAKKTECLCWCGIAVVVAAAAATDLSISQSTAISKTPSLTIYRLENQVEK